MSFGFLIVPPEYLFNPLLFLRNNTSKELSLFAESAAAVNRVVLQHMSINVGMWEVEGEEVAGLSPPSEARLLQRRKSLHNSQSLQLNRISSAGSKVLSIKVCLYFSLLTFRCVLKRRLNLQLFRRKQILK